MSPKRAITYRSAENVGKHRSMFCVEAFDGDRQVGSVCAAPVDQGRRNYVVGSEVEEPYRRRGIAAEMYRRLAEASCARGAPLSSDVLLSDEAEGFWQKQIRKKRARRVRYTRRIGKHTVRGHFYVLSCPAPRSLAGRLDR